jgi:hypothetical protein
MDRLYEEADTGSRLSTAGSLALDLHTIRKAGQRGVYNQMDDVKRSYPKSNEQDDFSTHLTAGDTQPFGARDASFEVQHPAFAHHDAQKAYKAQQQYDASQFGYAAPVQQTSYEGAGARLDRAFEREGA